MEQLLLPIRKGDEWLRLVSAGSSIVLIVLGYLYFNYDNRYFNSSVLLGLIFAPYIFRRTGAGISRRFLWVALGLGLLLCFRRSSTLFYFFAGTSILYMLESNWGKLNNLPIFLLALISALAGHIAYVWSFPIRLQMSSWAAAALSTIGLDTVASGNIIIRNGREFSVDPACMGLRMLVTAGILGLLMLAYFERRHRFTFSLFQTAGYLSLILILAIAANFIRLLTLIVFEIGPDHPMHDGVGVLSLLVYALVPFYLWLAYGKKWRQAKEPPGAKMPPASGALNYRTLLPYVLLLAVLLVNGPKFQRPAIIPDNGLSQLQVPGFESHLLDNGVLKLENGSALIYIKPPAGPLQATHDPRICWEGTGYVFSHIQKRRIGAQEVYTARLEKEGAALHTAWWFDNGRERTIGEWYWRWSSLTSGRGFRLVNVTTTGADELEQEVLAFLENEPADEL
jgi:exosortase N